MEEADEWVKKSEKDLLAAKINLQQKLYEVSAFLSHQAAEKILKALFILRFKRLWKIHDLVQLGEKIGAPENILDLCEKLNPHYLTTRYPIKEEYTEERAEEALMFSERVIKWTKEKIEKSKK